jgi:hypothetical protein
MNDIDKKIIALRKLTTNFVFIEWDVHESSDCYKIFDEYSKNKDKVILCKVEDGIEMAIDNAIKVVGKWRDEFFGK